MLRASLAERIGRITATEVAERESVEFWSIERPLFRAQGLPLGTEMERSVDRALRRSGVSACPRVRRGMLPEPWRSASCDWTFGAPPTRPSCAWWQPPEHTLVTAPQARELRAEHISCR